MNSKQFRLCGIIIAVALGALIGWSISVGNAILPVAAFIVGAALLYVCKSRVTEVLEDERVYKISEKASYIVLRVFVLSSALIGTVLIALSKNGFAEFSLVGITLAGSACALLVLHLVFYRYYTRKSLD
ncbi:MAG: DUF2178 domain-containing protein [archaeon]|nr:DUF2178 domain-containing protein [archaeon]